MQFQDVHLTDWHRLLVGTTPTTFLLEIVFRSIFTYIILLGAARLMGKRVAGQMSVMELTIMVTLGAAIGVPLEAPERGMIPAAVVLLVAVLYERGLGFWSFKSRTAELAFNGDVTTLVRDGIMDLDQMRRTMIPRERLFGVLREQGTVHLGQISRAYMEANGRFSIYTVEDPRPGLCIIPQEDIDAFEKQFKVDDQYACGNCGQVAEGKTAQPAECPRCAARLWSPAVQVSSFTGFKPQSGGGKGKSPMSVGEQKQSNAA